MKIQAMLLAGAALVHAQPAPTFDELLKSAAAAAERAEHALAASALRDAWTLAQQFDQSDPRRFAVLKHLVANAIATRAYDAAEQHQLLAMHWREMAVGASDPKATDELTELAVIVRLAGDSPRAVVILQRVLSTQIAEKKEADLRPSDTLLRIAAIRYQAGETDSAAAHLRSALRLREEAVGRDHPAILPIVEKLASLFASLRQYDQAELYFRRALAHRERGSGPDHEDLLPDLDGLAYALHGQRKFEEAEPVYTRLLALWEKTLDPMHPQVAMTLDKMAAFYRAQEARQDQAAAATARATAIRAHFLAASLRSQALQSLEQANRSAALRLFEQARATLNVSDHPSLSALRAEVDAAIAPLLTRSPARVDTKAGPVRRPRP